MIDIMPIPKFPSEKVKPLRKQLGLKQAELADRIGVTQELVSMWERGARVPTGPAAILLSQEAGRADLEIQTKNFQEC
jgi:DNA-binding transcriptional regulator YiaG